MDHFVQNLDIFVMLKSCSALKDHNLLYEKLSAQSDLNESNKKVLLNFCSKYCSNLWGKWKKSNHDKDRFINNNSQWLHSNITWPSNVKNILFPSEIVVETPSTSELNANSSSSSLNVSSISIQTFDLVSHASDENIQISTPCLKRRKPFVDLTNKQKRNRTDQIRSDFSGHELAFAAARKLSEEGNSDLDMVFNCLINKPEIIERVKQFIKNPEPKFYKMPASDALALLINLKLSKFQYENLHKSNKNIYPSYPTMAKAKLECLPSSIVTTESSARVQLQALLDKTSERLLMCLGENREKRLKLISKWGVDGASNQSNYKQKSLSNTLDDSNIFMASLVPIKLESRNGIIIWENETPNSSRYCRPICFDFMKENSTNVEAVINSLTAEIESLIPTKINDTEIQHDLLFTMIDGKITSYLSNTSTQKCDICKALPSEINNLDLILKKAPSTEIYKYGISSLHAWIRFMECLLHIAYRLNFKKRAASGPNKELLQAKKKQIQEKFRNEIGLLVDIVKQGSGTTNDGNTARRFFADPKITSEITQIDETLIKRFSVLLRAMSSGEKINVDKFGTYALDTAKLYVGLYNWYAMPPSVHKILIHGAEIISFFNMIPIGKLSEEASEARNKDFRNIREHHARKHNRESTNKDILHNFLLSSDPYISEQRPKINTHKKLFSEDVLN